MIGAKCRTDLSWFIW